MATGRRLTPTHFLKFCYGANWSVNLAPGDYAVDDGVTSSWMDLNNVPHPPGVDTRGLLHGNVAPRIASVTDGTSNTIMVSEDAAASPVLAEQGAYIARRYPGDLQGEADHGRHRHSTNWRAAERPRALLHGRGQCSFPR